MSHAASLPEESCVAEADATPRITLEGVGLRFLLERHSSLKSLALKSFRRLVGHDEPAEPPRQNWSLEGVDLTLFDGDRLGVVGRNGAGKTTLLRVLAGIYPPTVGRVMRVGSVAPVLQLGLGFNAELTGRENVRLAAAIAGTPQRVVEQRLPEVFAFAELEDFVDVPLKYYSSGMYARLAFAVATELETDTLLLDEIFAVGDAHWIPRALERIEQLIERVGVLVLVSHDLSLIDRVCNRAILLDKGRVVQDGAVSEVLERYRQSAET